MDKVGYKAYLQALGNQQHYIGRIQMLLDLEQELNIDLDDYIPYNDDYSKSAALDAILPEEKRYDERLFFSINSYMNYRLGDYNNNRAVESQLGQASACSEYFTFNGSEIELRMKLSTFMSESDSQTFVNGLRNYAQLLGSDEFVRETISFPAPVSESDEKVIHLLIKSSDFNINIKAATFITLALLLDIKLTLGIASAALTITGFNGQAIARVDVSEGERCLILEAMQSKNRIIDENVFSVCNSECVHSDLRCKYQSEDKCRIRGADIKRILDGLCDKNIFKKFGCLYKYNF